MQAIILAAGMGKRLGQFTKDNTKCMVKVNGVTLIDRVLNQLKKLNLNRIVIVTGYKQLKFNKLSDNNKQRFWNSPLVQSLMAMSFAEALKYMIEHKY